MKACRVLKINEWIWASNSAKSGFFIVKKRGLLSLILVLLFALSACGGGGGSAGGGATAISGKVIDGPVSNASIAVYQVTSAGLVKVGTGSTATDGGFSLSIPNYNSSDYYILFVSGGTFTNNGAGTNAPDMIGFLVPGGGPQVFITPVSTLIGDALFSNGALNQNLTAAQVQADIQQMLAALEQIFKSMSNDSAGTISSTDPTGQASLDKLVAELNAILQTFANDIAGQTGENYTQAMADLLNFIARHASSFSQAMQGAASGSGSFSLSGITISGGSGGTTDISGTLSGNYQTNLQQLMNLQSGGNGGNGGGSSAISGHVYSGPATPVAGSTVTLYSVGSSGSPSVLGSASSNSSGSFNIPYTKPGGSNILFLTAAGGNAGSGVNSGIMLAAIAGQAASAPSSVTVNELTTVMAVAVVGAPTGSISPAANYLPGNISKTVLDRTAELLFLENAGTGQFASLPSGFVLGTDNINALADVLASCVESASGSQACSNLYADSVPSGGTAPSNTLAAASDIYKNMFSLNMGSLSGLIPSTPPYSTAYSASKAIPNGAVVLNISGNGLNYATWLAPDPSGNIWVDDWGYDINNINNLTEIPVTNGVPGTPSIKMTGNYLTFNPTRIIADHAGNIWGGNETTVPQVIEIPMTNGLPGTPVNITGNSITFPGSLTVDPAGNIWMLNQNSGTVTEIPVNGGKAGTPVAAATVPGPAGYGPTAIASDPAGNIWVSDYQGSGQSGTVTEIPAAGGAAVNISVPVYPGVIASDPGGNIWVSGLTYPNYASELTEISASGGAQVNVTGGGLDGPNAIVSAPNGNIWVVDGGSAAAAGNSLTKIPVSKGTPGAPVSMLIPGMYNPRGLALDTDGNFWVLSDTQAQNIGGIKNNSVFVVMGGVAP